MNGGGRGEQNPIMILILLVKPYEVIASGAAYSQLYFIYESNRSKSGECTFDSHKRE